MTERIYYGAKDIIPNGFTRRANMREAIAAGQVRYFGVKTVDSRLIDNHEKTKKTKVNKVKELKAYARVNGLIKKLKGDIQYKKKQEDKDKAKKELSKVLEDRKKIIERLKLTDVHFRD